MSDPTSGPTKSALGFAPVSAFDDSQKRWATFLEYLKVNIGLTGGLLGAFALVFSDPSKVPFGFAKWVLAGITVSTLLSLIFSLVSIIWINRLVIDRSEAVEAKADPSEFTRLEREAGWITFINFLGFICLISSGACIVWFILLRISLTVPSLPAEPTVVDELRQIRQEQSKDSQKFQDIVSAGFANLTNRLDLIVAQPKDQVNAVRTLTDAVASLQVRISTLEQKQAEFERPLQQPKPEPKKPIKYQKHRK